MKDTIKVILMIVAFLTIFISLMIYGSYRNHQIEKGLNHQVKSLALKSTYKITQN